MVEEIHRFAAPGSELQGMDFGHDFLVENPKELEIGTSGLLILPSSTNHLQLSSSQSLFSSKARFHVAIAVLFMAGSVGATTSDNIFVNLGSDLAPLLALFGEEVTTQYLGESITLLDNIIFAIAPLGIITAMVSAIRVAGSPRLRSLIGRGKESRGTVESELMSSTSSDVCELWNGEGVVRVLGRPTFLQLVYVPSDSLKIYTFAEAVQKGFYRKRAGTGGYRDPKSADAEDESGEEADIEGLGLLAPDNPPNLSPNVSTRPLPPRLLLTLGVIGGSLQFGVLLFAAAIQYKIIPLTKNDEPIPAYSFWIILSGTLSLAAGMFLCARLIERSTEETYWEPTSGPGTEVIWLQQGGQTVGDQLFESFAHISEATQGDILISTKAKEKPHRFQVGFAIGASLVGFTAQFVGLRAMNPYVTVAQLGVIIFMTLVRSCAHLETKSVNAIEEPGNQCDGHELDWLAKRLHGCIEWQIVTGINNLCYSLDPGPTLRRAHGLREFPHRPTAIVKTRARLAELSHKWRLPNRTRVMELKGAIEATMKLVYDSMTLQHDYATANVFKWNLQVRSRFKEEISSVVSAVTLTLTREPDERGNWAPWEANKDELEAIFCLWISDIKEKSSPPSKHIRLLGTASGKKDYDLWTQRGTKLNEIQGRIKASEEVSYFGWEGNSEGERVADESLLSVDAGKDLEILCAQEIYAWFMFQVGGIIKNVGGETILRSNKMTTEDQPETLDDDLSQIGSIGLTNTNLAPIADCYKSSGLGTIENAYFCIIPALRAQKKLPVPHPVITSIHDFWLSGGNFKSSEGQEMLRVASEGGLEKVVEWLLDAGVDVNAPGDVPSWTPLQFAAQEGHDKVLQLLLSTGADVNAPPAKVSGRTALQAAAEAGHETTIRLLLNTRADINAPAAEVNGRTALQAAAQGGNSTLVQLLVEAGADVNAKPGEDSGRTALQAAAEKFHYTIVRFLLKSNADSNAAPARISGRTALQAAAEAGHEPTIRFLLNAKADINAPAAEVNGMTALQAAAQRGNDKIVRFLVKEGADVNAPPGEHFGRTALQGAAGGGHDMVVRWLLTRANADFNAPPAKFSGRTALQAAAEGGYSAVIGTLLAAGADINAPPAAFGGHTALSAAAQFGNQNNFKLLLDRGADANAVSGGKTVLQVAAGEGHQEIVKSLVRAGADVNARPEKESGRTALQSAAKAGHEKVVQLLLSAGAQVNSTPEEENGRTALQAAAEGGYENIVKMLLDSGADIDASPGQRFGRTALAAAAEGGHENVVKLLLDSGAGVDSPPGEEHGRTPLQAAAGNNYENVVQLLLRAGADVNEPAGEYSGRTALQAAAGNGHENLSQLLIDNGADVNAHPGDVVGRTALQAAAEGGHLGLVRLLLRHGALINGRPAKDSGRTALQAAAAGGHERVVKFLLDNGAELNSRLRKRHGRTALQAAAEAGHEKVVKLLLDAGEDVNAPPGNHFGRTALQAAASRGSQGSAVTERIVKMLIDAGADVNAPPGNHSGITALQAAAEGGLEGVVGLLLEAGVDVNALPMEEYGRTALQAAAHGGYEEIVRMLLEVGVEVNPRSTSMHYQLSALGEANSRGHAAIIKMLKDAGAV